MLLNTLNVVISFTLGAVAGYVFAVMYDQD